jgi:sarcosine oxidase gamma subunit
MRDLTSSWPPVPAWGDASLDRSDLVVRSVTLDSQHLVSGNLDAFAATAGLPDTGAGLFQQVSGDSYSLRVARDRILVVNGPAEALGPGWHAAGYAVTDVSAMYHAFEFSGDGVEALLQEAMFVDPNIESASAASMFAGQMAIVYHHAGKLRLHVERGYAPYIWQWLEARD